MKKISLIMIFLLSILLVSCVEKEEPKFDPDKYLDLENIVFDDFDNGIDPNMWVIGNSKWGVGNGGVIYENVHYTNDGIVVLQTNGDLYDGPLRGIGNNHGRRTGAMITTREALGPGRFEVRMRIMPRFGSTTAMWTYYYDNGMNHEIDIESNVENDFRKVWTTNWISLTEYSTVSNTLDFAQNDFEWRTYRFDWFTDPKRIDYYIDDVLVSSQSSYVPDHAGEFNIGNWFPDAWAGVPDFETDYTYVDWFKYTPFKEQPYTPTPANNQSPSNFYPSEAIEHPIANLISNAGFETDAPAWRYPVTSGVELLEGEGLNGSRGIFVPQNDIAYQFVTGLDETFEMTFSVHAKLPLNGSGYVLLEFYPAETQKIDQYMIEFNSSDEDFIADTFYGKEFTFNVPLGTKRVEVSLIGGDSGIYFDDLFFNLTKKPRPEIVEEGDDVQRLNIDFKNGIDSNVWAVANQRWGGTHHGGVIFQNVHYTEEGNLLIQANGDYYEGPLKGVEQNNGKRTGGAIYTKEAFGPGSFEVKAKLMPRFGATTAFWTFNYLDGINSEIDFEFNVGNDFSTVWLTNWLTETNYNNHTHQMDSFHNDGNWHIYRFEWHTLPTPHIKYFIDGKLAYTEHTKVPTMSARYWIGVWFPNNWAGDPNFETDYLEVEYFKYESFPDHPYVVGPTGASSPTAFYPTAPIKKPVSNLLPHGNLDYETGYMLTGDAVISNGELKTGLLGSAESLITGLNDAFELTLKLKAKASNNAVVRIEYLDKDLNVISGEDIIVSNLNANTFTNFTSVINLVEGTRAINVIFEGTNITYDDLFINLTHKVN
ncbi:glycoside hydrolase family 16 protein [Acholeplasma laidlawii]|uniref:glycoside hydrolase family 16 protein n=1 Tax=Acholeplasma laidlawii TaxID=2148 RepID=UPI0021F7A54B|nr:glycoside hydrolase family 16 protein [Acholeplasma laidlawii]